MNFLLPLQFSGMQGGELVLEFLATREVLTRLPTGGSVDIDINVDAEVLTKAGYFVSQTASDTSLLDTPHKSNNHIILVAITEKIEAQTTVGTS